MSEIKFVYFDIGGVLFNWKNALINFAKHVDRPYDDVFEIFQKYDDDVCRGKIDPSYLWQYYQKELKLEIEIDDFLDWWVDNFTPILPMHDLVREVSEKYRVGVITNIYHGAFIRMVKKGHVPDVDFEHVVESCEFNLIKPDKEFFQIAQKKAKVKADEILFIDDTKPNVDMANDLGWNSILFDESDPNKAIKVVKEALKLS